MSREFSSKPVLLLGMRNPGSTIQVAAEEGASAAKKQQRCMFAQIDSDNREQALTCLIRFVERREEKLKAEAFACGMKPEVYRGLKSGDTNTDEILKLGFEENYHVRVMVVGKEGVGKSTLTRRLIQLPVAIKQYNSTDGIEVHIRRCEIDLDSGTWSTKTRLSHEEKSFLQKFKGILKRGKKTKEESQHAATEVSRDYHERLAKVFQSADLPETLIETDEHMDDDSSLALSPQISTEPKQTKSELGGETQIQQGGRVPELPPEANKDANTITPKMSISKVDIETSLEKARARKSEENRKKAKVTFYDFAGQDIYHSSHPTFLDSSSIYIMVYDLQKTYKWQKKNLPINALGEYMKTLLHWLHVIYTIDSKLPVIRPHVLLVGTHADKLPKRGRHDIIKRSFDGFREYLVDFPFNIILAKREFAVDNTMENDPVNDEIKSTILQLAKLQPNWGQKTPAKWMPLDRKLELLKDSAEKVIPLEKLRDINRSLEVNLSNEEEIVSFLQFLHSNGEIIYFKEEGLENTIILDPVWMIDALKTIITAEVFAKRTHHLNKLWKEFRESGIIAKSAIVSIFKENDKDSSFFDNHEHLIRLMEKFMFIASPVIFPEEEGAGIGTDAVLTEDQDEKHFIMPCMVKNEHDKDMLKVEGKSSTTVLCIGPVSKFFPPAAFHKVLAMCITQWPIVEQNGRKMIFTQMCMFNIDQPKLNKLTVVHVSNEIHARVISYGVENQPSREICHSVMEFLTRSVKVVFGAMGFPSENKAFIQCPKFHIGQQGGLFELDHLTNNKSIGCENCLPFHVLDTRDLLSSWMHIDAGGDSPPGAAAAFETDDQEDLKQLCSVKSQHPDVVDSQHFDTPITNEHINHMRICIALVKVGANGLRDILASQLPTGYTDFYKLLLANEQRLRGQPRQFRPEQLQILYPDPQGRFTGMLDQFDITLLYALTRNINPQPVAPPVTGWGKTPDENPRDTTLGASVERIRELRNTFQGHSPDNKVDQKLFMDTWMEICQCMADIETVIGDHGYQNDLKEIFSQRFSDKELRMLQREFDEHVDDERSNLESLEKNLLEVLEKIRTKRMNLPARTLEINQ